MDRSNTFPRNNRRAVRVEDCALRVGDGALRVGHGHVTGSDNRRTSEGGHVSDWVERERLNFIQLMNEAFNTSLDEDLGRSRWCYVYWSNVEGIK